MANYLKWHVSMALAVLWWTSCGYVEGQVRSREKPHMLRLYEDLLGENSSYTPDVRPVYDSRTPTDVTVNMALAHIIDMDEKNQVLTADVWLRLNWTDEFLTWNATEYGGIDLITVKAAKIWRPDFFLYHNVNHEFDGWLEDVVMISSDGQVDWKAPAVTMSACLVDVSDFPFDKQKCPLKFGSWNQDGRQVNYVQGEDGDLKNLIENVEWNVSKLSVERHEGNFNGVPYPDVTFTIHMTRRSTFYVINMLVPCTLLAFVVGATFYLPPDCGEKISFGVSVLLSLAVFQLLVAEAVPRSENIPAIGVYIIVSMALMSLSLIAAAFVITLGDSVQDSKPVPNWARKVFLKYVSKALLMGDQSRHGWHSREHSYSPPTTLPLTEMNGFANGNGMYSVNRDYPSVRSTMSTNMSTSFSHSHPALEKQLKYLKQVQCTVQEILNKMKNVDMVHSVHNEWKILAKVVDRIFLKRVWGKGVGKEYGKVKHTALPADYPPAVVPCTTVCRPKATEMDMGTKPYALHRAREKMIQMGEKAKIAKPFFNNLNILV
ncbi:acetylcholine-gated cation-selective channel [Branchiostoma belcheri]|nr:acetylcholine-gated cation-selective channel [Branchiostoma belcheri]